MPLRPLHHRLPRQLAAILTLTALLTLTACGPGESRPHATPTPSGTDASGFASDEDALAAAEAVYREYLEVSDGIPDWDRLSELATPEVIASDKETHASLVEQGRHVEGQTTLASFSLQSYDGSQLTAYACLDIAAVRVIDETGIDVTPSDRPDRAILDVTFILDNMQFLLSESNLWSTSC